MARIADTLGLVVPIFAVQSGFAQADSATQTSDPPRHAVVRQTSARSRRQPSCHKVTMTFPVDETWVWTLTTGDGEESVART